MAGLRPKGQQRRKARRARTIVSQGRKESDTFEELDEAPGANKPEGRLERILNTK